MTARTAIILARGRAQTRMVDRCTITRTGAPSADRDPVTGAMLPAVESPVYSGMCEFDELRVQNPSPVSVAGDFPVSMIATLALPATGPLVQEQDTVTLTSAPYHPQHVGMRFKITAFNPKSLAKAQVFQMQAVIG